MKTIFYPNFASVIHFLSLPIPVLVVKLMISITLVDAYDQSPGNSTENRKLGEVRLGFFTGSESIVIYGPGRRAPK